MKRRIFFFLLLLLPLQGMCADGTPWYLNLKREAMPTYALTGGTFSATFTIINTDSRAVDDIVVSYTPALGTTTSVPHHFDTSLAAGDTAHVTIDGFRCDVEGESVQGTFRLASVNGTTNYGSDTYCYLFSGDRLVERNVVLETATSPYCGYCPRGIVAMEYMREKYTDGSWLGCNVEKEGSMSTTAYAAFWKNVSSSTPRCYLNRVYGNSISPSKLGLEDYYLESRSHPAVVALNATSTVADGQASIHAAADFVFSYSDVDYGFAYILTEDNLRGYQLNYYYDGNSGEMDGWEDKAYYVDYSYNDVVREGSVYEGIEGSLPATLEKATPYTYTTTLDLSGITDYSRAYVTVLVVDRSSKEVLNAARIPLDGGTTGLAGATTAGATPTVSAATGGIAVTPAADVTVTTLDGRTLLSQRRATFLPTPAGIYLVKAGNVTTKVWVK
jgi:hypothetical protein